MNQMRMTLLIGLLCFGCPAFAQDGRPVRPVERAPSFVLEDLDGHKVSSTNFTGTTRLFFFWVQRDDLCQKQARIMAELQRELGDRGLRVIGLMLDVRNAEATKAFLKDNGLQFQILLADYTAIQGYGGLEAVPTIVLVNRDGLMVDRRVGVMEKKEILEILRPFLDIKLAK
jgi:peroxiredoxin